MKVKKILSSRGMKRRGDLLVEAPICRLLSYIRQGRVVKPSLAILICFVFLTGSSVVLAKSSIWVFLTDLYNQASIKPQESGGMRKIPPGTVSTDGRFNEDHRRRFDWIEKNTGSFAERKVLEKASAGPLINGQLMFDTYCFLCHGNTTGTNEAGLANTRMNTLGMTAPAVLKLTPSRSDGFIYNKIKYGGTVMPSLGHATTESERWNLISYIRQLEKTQ